jgi:hypothetical protein
MKSMPFFLALFLTPFRKLLYMEWRKASRSGKDMD